MTDFWSAHAVLSLLDGELISSGDDRGEQLRSTEFSSVAIDSRAVQSGALFVALPGTQTHGALHAADAAGAGAAAMLVGSDCSPAAAQQGAARLPVIRTRETALASLGVLARGWRRHCGFTVVAVTGSTGKTSTKDILGALLSERRRTVASHANFNNELGVPLTVLGSAPDTEVVICEFGMRGLGQISYLCDIALPDIGIVTNVGAAHVELLGSVEQVVRAKAELLSGLASDGVGIVPIEQPEIEAAAPHVPSRVLRFGGDKHADCWLQHAERTETGSRGRLVFRGTSVEFDLPVHGLHQARNLAAAVCAYWAVEGSLEGLSDALANVELTKGRGDRYRMPDGGMVIDDAYNANPISMAAAIEELCATAGERRRVAVLGYMAELGAVSESSHRGLAALCRGGGVDELVLVGGQPDLAALADEYASRGGAARSYATTADAMDDLHSWWRPGDCVLVKASNSVGLGTLAQQLAERASRQVSLEVAGQ